jgi:small redox-active disulfide protein 2
MNIKILGAGCARCRALEKTVREAVADLKSDAVVEDIQDIKKIMEYHVLMTPGLVIDEKLISSGKVLSKDEIIKEIKKASAA